MDCCSRASSLRVCRTIHGCVVLATASDCCKADVLGCDACSVGPSKWLSVVVLYRYVGVIPIP